MTVADFRRQRRGRGARHRRRGSRRRRPHPGGGRGHPGRCGQNTNLGILLLAAPLALRRPNGRRPAARPALAARSSPASRSTDARARLPRHSARVAPAASGSERPARRAATSPTVTLLEAMRARRRPRSHRPAIRHRLRGRVRHRRGQAARLPGSRLGEAWAITRHLPRVPRPPSPTRMSSASIGPGWRPRCPARPRAGDRAAAPAASRSGRARSRRCSMFDRGAEGARHQPRHQRRPHRGQPFRRGLLACRTRSGHRITRCLICKGLSRSRQARRRSSCLRSSSGRVSTSPV